MSDTAQLKSTLVDFDPVSGLSKKRPSIQRYLSNMKGMFYDAAAYSYCVIFVGKACARGAFGRSRDIAAVV